MRRCSPVKKRVPFWTPGSQGGSICAVHGGTTGREFREPTIGRRALCGGSEVSPPSYCPSRRHDDRGDGGIKGQEAKVATIGGICCANSRRGAWSSGSTDTREKKECGSGSRRGWELRRVVAALTWRVRVRNDVVLEFAHIG